MLFLIFSTQFNGFLSSLAHGLNDWKIGLFKISSPLELVPENRTTIGTST